MKRSHPRRDCWGRVAFGLFIVVHFQDLGALVLLLFFLGGVFGLDFAMLNQGALELPLEPLAVVAEVGGLVFGRQVDDEAGYLLAGLAAGAVRLLPIAAVDGSAIVDAFSAGLDFILALTGAALP